MSKYLWVALAALTLFLVYTHVSKGNLAAEFERYRQNTAALDDSLRETRNRAGELESVRLTLIADVDDLKELNAELAEEARKEHGTVLALTRINAELRAEPVDDIESVVTVGDSMVTIEWEYVSEDSTRFLSGVTEYFTLDGTATTSITKDVLMLQIVTGFTERDDGMFETFARSDNSHAVLNVQGAILKPKMVYQRKKHWSVGPFLGVALTGDGRIQPVLGVGVTYGLFSF